MKTLAIIGSGIAGMGSAYLLRDRYEITVFEKDYRIGGHTNTVIIDEDGSPVPIDTGFMVYNEATYPNLTRLFSALGVVSKPTDMSFSVKHLGLGFEWSGTGYGRLFGDRANLLRPRFWRFLLKLDKFNKDALLNVQNPEYDSLSVRDYVERLGYGKDFLDLYLLPMMSALWSASPSVMLDFPIASLLRFMRSHGLLSMYGQHRWLTVDNGSVTYMNKIRQLLPGAVRINTGVRKVARSGEAIVITTDDGHEQSFDKCIIAAHADQTLEMLENRTDDEHAVLSAFKYQTNIATLHTYPGVMPLHRRNWASWNYRLQPRTTSSVDASSKRSLESKRELSRGSMEATDSNSGTNSVAVKPRPSKPLSPVNDFEASTHYWMNSLQNISEKNDNFVSVGGASLIPEAHILHTIKYEHPIFTVDALRSQRALVDLNRREGQKIFFAGSYFRYGFHEDAFNSAVMVSELLGGEPGWKAIDV
jgi:predicted NAD/FAD-binding protein